MAIEAGRDLLRMVRGASVRLTISRSGRTAARAGVAAMAACLLVALAGAVFPAPSITMVQALVLTAASVLSVAVFSALLRPVPRLIAALALDSRLGLEERVSTAVEILTGTGSGSPLAPRVVADAERKLYEADIAAVTPFGVPRTLGWIAVLAAILFVWTWWLHGITVPGTPAHRSAEVIRKEGQRLEQFARTLQSRARAEHMPATRRVTPQIQDLGSRLQREGLTRAEALARVDELSQQLEQTRREIDQRLRASQPAPSRDGVPSDQLRRQSTQRQIRQLQELLSRLRQDSTAASRDALEQLHKMTAAEEGAQPTRVQQQLQQARERLERGNVAGARDAISDAMFDLHSLDSLLADSEGIRSAQQQVERSQSAIAGGSSVAGPPEAAPQDPQASQGPIAPGDQPPSPDQSGDSTLLPQGPNEGSTPGRGRRDEKIGGATPRLDTTKTPQRVRGAQAEGPVTSSEIVGSGRSTRSRVDISNVSPAVVARADQAMSRSRTPARYRDIVRRYFQRLAKLK